MVLICNSAYAYIGHNWNAPCKRAWWTSLNRTTKNRMKNKTNKKGTTDFAFSFSFALMLTHTSVTHNFTHINRLCMRASWFLFLCGKSTKAKRETKKKDQITWGSVVMLLRTYNKVEHIVHYKLKKKGIWNEMCKYDSCCFLSVSHSLLLFLSFLVWCPKRGWK